jgi:hypothetical protein
MLDNPEPSDEQIKRVFTETLDPVPDTFEIALVLGGTVSAGAYTAGVLDFLIEALDCWEAARQAGQHRVALRVVAGTSGGGVNAAILARALAYPFPHVAGATARGDSGSGNPFFDIWVNEIGLAGLLSTGDLDHGGVTSLLNGEPIDRAAALAAGFAPAGAAPRHRPYVGRRLAPAGAGAWDPLHVILTLTNLAGIPYLTRLDANRVETFVQHADYARFAVCYPGADWADPRPDETTLGFGDQRLPRQTDWDRFSLFARATSAFPIGLPPRVLARPLSDYRYRVAAVAQPDGSATLAVLKPDWPQLMPPGATPEGSTYHLLAVDGGATDNEPIELARTALSGVLGRNDRGATSAQRAVILVDPFAGQATLGPTQEAPLPILAGALANALMQQTRYDTQDLLLAADEDVYSRFMITAVRNGYTGGDAIASAGLGAFLGFACADYMRHDFLLGRRNCQKFLRDHFGLAGNAAVFKAAGNAQENAAFLPLVPLLGGAAVEEPPPEWPRYKLDPEQFRSAIEARFDRIAEIEGGSGVVGSTLAWLAGHLGQHKAADFVIDQISRVMAAAKPPL